LETVTAIVPAAGKSVRMGVGQNKVLINVAGEPILSWVLKALCATGFIKRLIICVREDEQEDVLRIAERHRGSMEVELVMGGSERQESVYNALKVIGSEDGYVVVHDAARPLVTPQLVSKVVEAAFEYGAATAGIPCTDTVKEADASGFVLRTLSRQSLYLVQTPQAFSCRLLIRAHERARELGLLCTDDAGLVEAIGAKVKLVVGDPCNIKVTERKDLLIVEAFLNERIASGKVIRCGCELKSTQNHTQCQSNGERR